MTLDVSAPDDAPDLSAHDQSLLERIQTLETRAADVTALDEVATRLDRIETRLSRPSARVESRDDQAELERKAFLSFCRRGLDGMSDLEKKVLTANPIGSPATDGYQLVPEFFLREMVRNLTEINEMRQVSRVQQVSGGPVLIPKRTENLTAAWVAETVEHDLSEPSYTQMQVGIFEARVTVEVTNQLLEDSAFDLAAELSRDFAEEFGRLEGEAFVSGSGMTQPQGLLSSPDFVSTLGAITADSLIDLFHSVPSVYARNGTWLMARATMGAARKLKATGTGNYLWTESLQPGNPPSILGRPVVEMPGLAGIGSPSGQRVVFGDLNQAFRIFDRVGLEILRDPYTAAMKSIVRFHARKRVGSALVNAEAVRGLATA
jgi:HK97 family phage major capsid protein